MAAPPIIASCLKAPNLQLKSAPVVRTSGLSWLGPMYSITVSPTAAESRCFPTNEAIVLINKRSPILMQPDEGDEGVGDARIAGLDIARLNHVAVNLPAALRRCKALRALR